VIPLTPYVPAPDAATGPCRRLGCQRERMRDALFCREDINLLWAGALAKRADGSYIGVAPRTAVRQALR
jgi:hypothetical protein